MTNVAFSVVGLLVAIGSSTVARAEAPAPGGRCAVEIARAPDEAHEAIARWVAQEPRCGAPLTVRVVPTADGLYVLAQAADGRTFERVVPDAEAAGVLVASWAARVEDQAAARAPVVAPGVPAVAPAPAAADDGGRARARASEVWNGRWIEVAASVGEYDTAGAMVAGRLALAGTGGWSLGLAADLRVDSVLTMTPLAMAERRARIEAAGALQGAWTLQAAAWRVRAELGLGLGAERFYDWLALYRVRAGLEVGRHLAGRWGGFVRGEATTAREGLADVVHDVTDFTNDTHWLGVAVGVATPL
jgi:hypothetical protein